MLLRASGQATGHTFDLHAVTEGTTTVRSGVAHEETLVALAEAMVSDDELALATARARILAELGPQALVDAAGVASNFERMVRIADATGIPLDNFLDEMTGDLRTELHLTRFESVTDAQ
jgi:D-serine deaminase-like pyridoxal phosphate-dependent protein